MSGRQGIPPRLLRSPAAAASLFVLVGLALLLIPELIAKTAAAEPADLTDFVGDLAFLAFGAAAVWYLASRIRAAFRLEAEAREVVEARERVLADAVDAVPAAVLLLDERDELVVAHANPSAAKLLGTGSPEARSRRLADVLPIDNTTLEAIAHALETASRWSGERTITTDTGRRVPLSLDVTPIAKDGGARAVLIAEDRTELQYAERESERLAVELEGFVETAPLGFVTVGADGLVAAWNAAAERILGWTAAEMVGARLPPELGTIVAEALAAGAGLSRYAAAPTDSPEVALARSTGEQVIVRLTAMTEYGRGHDFFGFTLMFEDVTQARRVAAERDAVEARFRAAVDASPLPLILLDPDGKVGLWSAAAERLFGWTADEAMGRVFPAVPEEGMASFHARLHALMDGDAAGAERLPCVARDGRAVDIRFWTAPVRAPDGTLLGVMATCREEHGPGAAGATMGADIPLAHASGGPPA